MSSIQICIYFNDWDLKNFVKIKGPKEAREPGILQNYCPGGSNSPKFENFPWVPGG